MSFFKLLFITILVSPIAFATDTYVFYVDSPEMVDQYFLTFNAMKNIFAADSYLDALRFIFLVGGVFALASGILNGFAKNMNGAVSGYFKYLIIGVSLLVLLFVGKSDVLIKSTTYGSYCDNPTQATTVSGFPTLLGFSFNYINKLGTNMTLLSEQHYSGVSSSSILNGGYAHSIKDSIKLLSVNLEDDYNLSTTNDLNLQLKTFFSQCMVIPFSSKGIQGEQELSKLKANNDIYAYLEDLYQTNPRDIGGINSRDYSLESNGEIFPCGVYYDRIKPNLDKFRLNSPCFVDIDDSAVSLVMGGENPPQSDFADVAMQAGLISTLDSAYNELGTGVDAVNYASGKSKAEMVQENIANGQYLSTMLPLIQSTLRLVLYAFFPFLFVVVLFPGGGRILGQYLRSLLWVELWTPVAAVLNLFLNYRAQNYMSDIYSSDGLTLMNAFSMMSEVSVISGVAGYLYMMVPGLTWAFVTGTSVIIENLGHALGKTMMKNIRTESINLDVQNNEMNREVQRQTGNNNLSLAETQHYQSVQAGRVSGATIGRRGQKDLALMADFKAHSTQKDISTYEATKKTLGVGGEELGKTLGKAELLDRVTNLKIQERSTGMGLEFNEAASDHIDVEVNKEMGKMGAQSDQKDRLSEDFFQSESSQKMVKEQANVNTLNHYKERLGGNDESIEKQASTKTKDNIHKQSETDAYVKSRGEAEYMGDKSGKNKNWNVKTKRAEQSYLSKTGVNENSQGINKARDVHVGIQKKVTDRQQAQKEGYDTNKDGHIGQGEMNKFTREQHMANTKTYSVDKDGNAIENEWTIHGDRIKEHTRVLGQYTQEGFVRVKTSEQVMEDMNSNARNRKQLLEILAHGGAGKTKNLAEVIAHGEGTSDAIARLYGYQNGYQVTYGHGRYVPKGTDITKMTFREIKDLREVMKDNQEGNEIVSTAMGKYQFDGRTLKEFQKKAKLTDDDLFSIENQDKMGLLLLNEAGLESYQKGYITAKEFQDKLAGRWASVAESETNASRYGQPVGTDTNTIQAAIKGQPVQLEARGHIDRAKYSNAVRDIYTTKEIQHFYSNMEEAARMTQGLSQFMRAKVLAGYMKYLVNKIADGQKKKKQLQLLLSERKHKNQQRKLRREVKRIDKEVSNMIDMMNLDSKEAQDAMKLQDKESLLKLEKELKDRVERNKIDSEYQHSKKTTEIKKTMTKKKVDEIHAQNNYMKDKQKLDEIDEKNKRLSAELETKKESKEKIEKVFDQRIEKLRDAVSKETDFSKKIGLEQDIQREVNARNDFSANSSKAIQKMERGLKGSKEEQDLRRKVAGIEKRDSYFKSELKNAEVARDLNQQKMDTSEKKISDIGKNLEDLYKNKDLDKTAKDKQIQDLKAERDQAFKDRDDARRELSKSNSSISELKTKIVSGVSLSEKMLAIKAQENEKIDKEDKKLGFKTKDEKSLEKVSKSLEYIENNKLVDSKKTEADLKRDAIRNNDVRNFFNNSKDNPAAGLKNLDSLIEDRTNRSVLLSDYEKDKLKQLEKENFESKREALNRAIEQKKGLLSDPKEKEKALSDIKKMQKEIDNTDRDEKNLRELTQRKVQSDKMEKLVEQKKALQNKHLEEKSRMNITKKIRGKISKKVGSNNKYVRAVRGTVKTLTGVEMIKSTSDKMKIVNDQMDRLRSAADTGNTSRSEFLKSAKASSDILSLDKKRVDRLENIYKRISSSDKAEQDNKNLKKKITLNEARIKDSSLNAEQKIKLAKDNANMLKDINSNKELIVSNKERTRLIGEFNYEEKSIRKEAQNLKQKVTNSLRTSQEKAQKKVFKKNSRAIVKAQKGMVKKYHKSEEYKVAKKELDKKNSEIKSITDQRDDVIKNDKISAENKDKILSSFNSSIDTLSKEAKELNKEIKRNERNAKAVGSELGKRKALQQDKSWKRRGLEFVTMKPLKIVNGKTLRVGMKTTKSVNNNFAKYNGKVSEDLYKETLKKDPMFAKSVKALGSITKAGGLMYLLAEAENQAKGVEGNTIGYAVKHAFGYANATVSTGFKGYYTAYKAYDDSTFIDDSIERMEGLQTEIDRDINELGEIGESLKRKVSSMTDEEYATLLEKEILVRNNIDTLKDKVDQVMDDAKYVADAMEKYRSNEEVFKAFTKQTEEARKDFADSTWTGGTWEAQDTLIEKGIDAYNFIKDNISEERMETFYKTLENIKNNSDGKSLSLIEKEAEDEFGKLFLEARFNNHNTQETDFKKDPEV